VIGFLIKGDSSMSEENKEQPGEISVGQKFFDNIWLLLVISIVITTVMYNVWGIIELMTRPVLP
jgi:hypothetical protein